VINSNLHATERRIISRIVDRAIQRGYTVSVHDSIDGDGAWTVKRSQDRDAIIAALATTGGDVLRIRDANGAVIGSVVLVYNGDDSVVADHTDNDAMRAVVGF